MQYVKIILNKDPKGNITPPSSWWITQNLGSALKWPLQAVFRPHYNHKWSRQIDDFPRSTSSSHFNRRAGEPWRAPADLVHLVPVAQRIIGVGATRASNLLESVGPRSGGALCSADFGPGQLRSHKDTPLLDLDLKKNIWLGNVGQIMTSYSGWNRVVPRFQTQPDFCKGHHQDLFGRTTQSVRFGCINRRNYKPKGLKYHQQLQWWEFNLFGITNDYRENLKSSITKPVAFSRVWTLAGESHSYETSLGFCTYSQLFNPLHKNEDSNSISFPTPSHCSISFLWIESQL